MKIKKTLKFTTLYNSLTDSEKFEFYEYLKSSLSPKLHIPKSIIENFKPGVNISELQLNNLRSQTIWNINSQLSKALKMYIAIKELSNDPDLNYRLIRVQLKKRNLDRLLTNKCVTRINELNKSKIQGKSFRNLADAYMDYLQTLLSDDDKKKQLEVYELYNKYFSLSMIFELIILRFNNEVTSNSQKESKNYFLNDFYNCIDFGKIMELLKTNFPNYYPVIGMWNDFYELYSVKFDLEKYHIVKNNFFSIMDQFSDELKSGSFNVLTDLLIVKREELGIDLDGELFEIFFKKEAQGLTEDFTFNRIGYNHFRDNILIAINVGEIEWAEYFLNKYSDTLPEKQKNNDLNTGKARISFSKGEFKDSITFIGKLKKSSFIHYSDYFRISIKANFELSNYNECFLLAEKFSEYLKRNKNLPSSFVNGSKFFIKNIAVLSEYKMTSDRKRLKKIDMPKLQVKNSSNKWLLDKFNILIKSNS